MCSGSRIFISNLRTLGAIQSPLVTGNESFFDSPLKGAVEHEMNAPHRGTAQSLSTGFGFPLSALFHQVLVELLEVTGSQLGQLDVSDAGDSVGVDHQIVAVCCGYPHIGLGIEVIPGFEPGSHCEIIRHEPHPYRLFPPAHVSVFHGPQLAFCPARF